MTYTTKHEYTDEQMIQRVTDVLEIRNIMAKHAYYHSKGMHVQELAEIWVQKPENQATASFGQNWGYNVGMKRIDAYYGQGSVENNKRDLEALAAADPSIEVKPENYGMGSMVIHALTAPYVEVAVDGQTAQGLWYSPGAVGGVHPDGTASGMLMYEKYGVDFIKEDGEWKIWHLFVGTDFSTPPGEGFGGPTELEREKNPPPPGQGFPGGPPPGGGNKEPDPYYFSCDAYTMKFNYCHQKPLPKPYWTFSETRSYGPDGEEGFSWDMVYGGK